MDHRNESRRKIQAFRWMMGFIFADIFGVALLFLGLFPIEIGYWILLFFAAGAIGAMVVFFVAHQEARH